MRILLVEDDNRTAQFVKKGFVQAGYAVDRAADGLEGLFMAQDVAYDAAVIDIMLPKLDGLVQSIIQAHGGTIDIISIEGAGTQVTVCIDTIERTI